MRVVIACEKALALCWSVATSFQIIHWLFIEHNFSVSNYDNTVGLSLFRSTQMAYGVSLAQLARHQLIYLHTQFTAVSSWNKH